MAVRKTSGRAAAETQAAEQEASSQAKPTPIWNGERRTIFLETLALTANVAASERAAGMTVGSAHRERRKSPTFREAWGEALADGYSRLELVLLERALAGIAKRTTRTAKRTVVEDYSDRLGMTLLMAHRATVAARRGAAPTVDAETAKQRLARRIEDMARRLGNG